MNIGNKEIIHFLGVGGIGMSGLAQIMKIMGFNVQGSDLSKNKNTENCKKKGINFFRGSKNNVAKRFLDCSLKMNIDYAVRINGDNIFTDPSIITKMLNITRSNKWIFITNVLKRTFPQGISVEIIKVSHLKEKIAFFDNYEKEHVMPYFYKNLSKERVFNYDNTGKKLSNVSLALDTIKDFSFLSSIIDLMEKPHSKYNIDEIIDIIKVNKLCS